MKYDQILQILTFQPTKLLIESKLEIESYPISTPKRCTNSNVKQYPASGKIQYPKLPTEGANPVDINRTG